MAISRLMVRGHGGALTRRWTARHGAPVVAAALTLPAFATGISSAPHTGIEAVLYDVVLFNAAPVLSVVLCVLAGRRVPAERVVWWGAALTMALTMVGNVVFGVAAAGPGGAPYPSAADAWWLASYIPLFAVPPAVLRLRLRRLRPTTWLDGLIGALGVTAVAVVVVIGPWLETPGLSGLAATVTLAYPVADVLILGLVGAMVALVGLRADLLLVLTCTVLANKAVGDLLLTAQLAAGGYVPGGPLDLIWIANAVLISAAAVLAPRPVRPDEVDGTGASWRSAAVPLACATASLVVLALEWGDLRLGVGEVCAVGCVVASMARTALTVPELRTLHDVRRQAVTDDLTGLPNRRALFEQVRAELATASTWRPAAMLLLDLDGFKEVNDGLGHQAGDQLLRQIGPRLRPALRDRDLLARLGGDEFAVLLPDTAADEAESIAHRLRELILQPLTVDGIRLRVGVSIGVACAPVPAATLEELLRCSDAAMYAAKTTRSGVHVHVPDPPGAGSGRLRTMKDLRTALERDDELEVHFQPQVGLAGGGVVGAEALVRWRHPVRGLLLPAELLPAAEQAGLLRPLTDAVLELALTAVAGWWPERAVPVSVNLSAANVTDLDLPGKVAAALARHCLPTGALTLELVEETLIADPQRSHEVLEELRRLGVRTSIDDYGTGYSSLAYLRHLPADELKLDRSLTHDVGSDPRAAAIVRHTVALVHELGLSLVAEGVEDDATGAVLRDLGCDVAQGYAIARPMPVEDFLAWLDQPVRPLTASH